MPLNANCWITLDDLKAHLDIPSSDTTKDTFLTNRLNGAFNAVKNYIGQDLNAADYIEDYDGEGSNTLLLRQFPVNSISAIYDDCFRTWQNSPFVPDSSTLLDPHNYYVDKQIGLITVFQGIASFRDCHGNIHVLYNAGYTSIPDDAIDGLTMWAAWYCQRAGTEGRMAETMGGRSQQYEHDVPEYIKQMLKPYKHYSV